MIAKYSGEAVPSAAVDELRQAARANGRVVVTRAT